MRFSVTIHLYNMRPDQDMKDNLSTKPTGVTKIDTHTRLKYDNKNSRKLNHFILDLRPTPYVCRV